MNRIRVKALREENFKRYGCFVKMIPPEGRPLGPAPIQFYPDLLRMSAVEGNLGISVNRLQPRDLVITALECHDHTQEFILPLNGDALVHVAPPTRKNAYPLNEVEVFFVPAGTALIIHAGVWHHAPFPIGGSELTAMVALPERTYENDCFIHRLGEEERIAIDWDGKCS